MEVYPLSKISFQHQSKKQLTKRDIAILQFVNTFGFCTLPHLEQHFALKSRRAYQLMQRLIQVGYIQHQRIFHAQHGIYYLTDQGATCTDLPAIDKIPIGIYYHQLRIIDVYLKLRQQYPHADWVSERYLKHEKFYKGIGQPGHTADGILRFTDGKYVAIEIELSLKSKNRLSHILKFYGSQLHIHEVWYYCTSQVIPTLKTLAEKLPFVKIHSLDTFLA
jgi:hypothetical protein